MVNEEKASMDELLNNRQSEMDQRIRAMHEERISQVLEMERIHNETVVKDCANLKRTLTQLTEKYLAAESEIAVLKAELEKKQNHIAEVEGTHIQAVKLINRLNADANHLMITLDSARKWLKKPFYRTMFSRWKPPQRTES